MITGKRSDKLSPLNHAGITPGSEENLQALRRVLPTIWIKNMLKIKKHFLLCFVLTSLIFGCGGNSENNTKDGVDTLFDVKQKHIKGSTFESDIGEEISFGKEEVFESGARECRTSIIPSRASCAYNIEYAEIRDGGRYVQNVNIMMYLPSDEKRSVEILDKEELKVGYDSEEDVIYTVFDRNRFKRQ